MRALILVLTVSTLAAQPATDWGAVRAIAPGTTIRADTAPQKWTGEIESVTEDAIVLRSKAGEQTLMRSQILRVGVKKPGHRKRNALIGLGVGAGAGAGVAIAVHSCQGLSCLGSEIIEIAAPVILILAGVLVGALLPTGGWRFVYQSQAP
jgi:hypothetical protein